MKRNGLKFRGNIFREGSSPSARTNCLLVRLLTDEDQEWSTSSRWQGNTSSLIYSPT